MQITRQDINPLNTIIGIDITKEDYQDEVTETLKGYRKKANIPGFRKGCVPMGLIKKQYGKSVMIDQVNKLLQERLNTFLTEEKIAILGEPLPKTQDNFSWDADTFSFEFELGLAPEFEIDLTSEGKIKHYKITANEQFIDKELESLQDRYGKTHSSEVVTKTATVSGVFVNQEKNIDKKASFSLKDVEAKASLEQLVGAKVGEELSLETKNLFKNSYQLATVLGIDTQQAMAFEASLHFTIEEIKDLTPADLDQEFFNKVSLGGSITSVTDLKKQIKQDLENQFEGQADQYLLDQIITHLTAHTKFDLPAEFLQKWMQVSQEHKTGEKVAVEEIVHEYNKSEKALRYQLIEQKLIEQNDIKTDYKALINFTKSFIRTQFSQYGNDNEQKNMDEKELEAIATNVLANKEEAKRLQDRLVVEKMLAFYKERMAVKTEEITYESFTEMVKER